MIEKIQRCPNIIGQSEKFPETRLFEGKMATRRGTVFLGNSFGGGGTIEIACRITRVRDNLSS